MAGTQMCTRLILTGTVSAGSDRVLSCGKALRSCRHAWQHWNKCQFSGRQLPQYGQNMPKTGTHSKGYWNGKMSFIDSCTVQ